MTKNKLAIYAIVALVFGGIGAYVATRTQTPAQVAAPAPAAAGPGRPVDALYALTMTDASGTSHKLSQWQGKALVVNFWAPWCAPCVKEMPELDELGREMAAKNVQVIGIGMDSQDNIAQFAKKLNIQFPLYVAGMGGTGLPEKLGNPGGGLPFTVLIGPDGTILKTYLGILKFDELKADLANIKS